MKQTKTLAQVANEVENGNIYYNETNIKCGTFDSFADFLGYYRQHYRPLLQAIENGEAIDDNRRHLLNFLASDLLQMFADSDEEGETVAVVVLTFIDADNFKKAQRFFDSDGPSQFWASDWDEQARTIEFTEGNDPDALGAALIEEMQAEGITGYTWQAFRQNID
jgi:hypothetical protein